MSEELLKCPCGKAATQRTEIFMSGERLYPQVKCDDRHCCFGKWWHDIDKWNTRAQPMDKECAEALEGLLNYNVWRRGCEKTQMPEPKQLGLWLDTACKALSRPQVDIDTIKQMHIMIETSTTIEEHHENHGYNSALDDVKKLMEG